MEAAMPSMTSVKEVRAMERLERFFIVSTEARGRSLLTDQTAPCISLSRLWVPARFVCRT
jgi:hypothetical protein